MDEMIVAKAMRVLSRIEEARDTLSESLGTTADARDLSRLCHSGLKALADIGRATEELVYLIRLEMLSITESVVPTDD